MRLWGALFLIVPLASACSGECQLTDPTSCDPGLVCAPLANSSSNACVPPVEVRGRVFDAISDAGVGGALVNATDQTGVPAAELTSAGKDGAFTLRLLLVRADGSGTPQNTTVTLQAGASGFEGYPGKLRVPLTIDTKTSTQGAPGQPFVLEGASTNLALQPLPPDQANYPFIAGTVEFNTDQGAPLIVAEANGAGFSTTLADSFGQFVLFNVPPGTYSLGIYAQNATFAKASGIQVAVGQPANAVIVGQTGATLAMVTGSVTLPSGAAPTSVVMIPRSTFDPTRGRGVVAPSLRAPPAGTAANVTGTFTITGVPDGDYYLAPSYENDGWVRQPGTGKDGLGVQEVVVTNGLPTPATVPDLKVVPAVTITSPGATGLESGGPVPTLTWAPYPSAQTYDVKVFNSAGDVVFQTSGTSDTSVQVSPSLGRGVFQWRVTALDGAGQALSTSEDLAGLFSSDGILPTGRSRATHAPGARVERE